MNRILSLCVLALALLALGLAVENRTGSLSKLLIRDSFTESKPEPGEGGVELTAVERSTPLATPQAGCSFFDSWRQIACSRANVAGFFEQNNDVTAVDLNCVPIEWLLLAIAMYCEGDLIGGNVDIPAVASNVALRITDSFSISAPIFEGIAPAVLGCLAQQLQPYQTSTLERAQLWAWMLTTAFGGQGSMFEASPDVVASLQVIMQDWPLEDDAWWAALWSAFPGDLTEKSLSSHERSLNVRVAIYEALHGILSESEWIARLASLAQLESYSRIGSASLWCVGDCLRKHLPNEETVSLFGLSDSVEWQRALLFAFPNEMKWPALGHAQVPRYTFDQIAQLRDSKDYPFRIEILLGQWALLGPAAAVSDLEAFTFHSNRLEDEWDYLAGIRVSKAVSALIDDAENLDPKLADRAHWLVLELLVNSPPKEINQILNALKNRDVAPMDPAARDVWRKRIYAIIGAHALFALEPEYRAWLEAS